MNKLVNCVDYYELLGGATGFSTTEEGFLQGRVCVTCAGVFPYRGEDGKVHFRYRSVDEVSRATASLNNKVVTLLHPNELVNITNVNKVNMGFSGGDATFEGDSECFVTLTITDAKAIKAIRDGKVKAISCGYTCEIEDSAGNYHGSEYDQCQKNIKYNHIALVAAGRAGDCVNFTLNDSAEEIYKLFEQTKTKPNEDNTMKKLVIGDCQYEVDESVASAFSAMKKELEGAKDSCEKAIAERDSLKASLDAKDAEIASLKASVLDDKAIAEKVKARAALEKVAADCGIEKYEEMDDKSIKCAVIAKKLPTFSLEGASDERISIGYEASLSVQTKQADNSLENHQPTNSNDELEKAKAEFRSNINK